MDPKFQKRQLPGIFRRRPKQELPGIFRRDARKARKVANEEEEEKWLHELREALRLRELKKAAWRRDDMRGAGEGVDRPASRALLESGTLTRYQEGLLRKIMAGAVYTEDRAARHFKRGSPMCPFCGKTEETRDHLF